jgi:TPR repeat protein
MRRAPLNLTLAALFGAVPIWPQDAPGKSVFTESQRNALCDTARKLKPEDAPALRHKAEAGDVDAQLILALAYGDKLAAEWAAKAADQGNASGQTLLGWAYNEGKGVRKDAETAVKYFRLAAEQGASGAAVNLGMAYRDGKGFPKTAIKRFTGLKKRRKARWCSRPTMFPSCTTGTDGSTTITIL